MYDLKAMDDLQRFYDRYCKDVQNGWEHDIPPIRLSLLGFGSVPNIVERAETQFPLQRQQLATFYLNSANTSLDTSLPSSEGSVSHAGHDLRASSVSKTAFAHSYLTDRR